MTQKQTTEHARLTVRKTAKITCPCLVINPEREPDYETKHVMLCNDCKTRLTTSPTGITILHRGPYRIAYVRMPYRKLRKSWQPQFVTVDQFNAGKFPPRPEPKNDATEQQPCANCRGL